MAVQQVFARMDEGGVPTDGVHRAMLDKLVREVIDYKNSQERMPPRSLKSAAADNYRG
jgi:hypothetical protein